MNEGTGAVVWSAARVTAADETLRAAPLDAVLRWAVGEFGSALALATGFGPQSIVLMHALSRIDSSVPVFYLDTGLLFDETYELRDRLARRLGIEPVRVRTALSVSEQARQFGPALWQRDPDRCCELRKVQPLAAFLRGRRAWITGIRRSQTAQRAGAGLVEWDLRHELVKINPLVLWNDDRVQAYLRRHRLPTNSLHDRGYPSVGCWPCTRPVAPGEDARAGRWSGREKTECGIHLAPRPAGGGTVGLPAIDVSTGQERPHEGVPRVLE